MELEVLYNLLLLPFFENNQPHPNNKINVKPGINTISFHSFLRRCSRKCNTLNVSKNNFVNLSVFRANNYRNSNQNQLICLKPFKISQVDLSIQSRYSYNKSVSPDTTEATSCSLSFVMWFDLSPHYLFTIQGLCIISSLRCFVILFQYTVQ